MPEPLSDAERAELQRLRDAEEQRRRSKREYMRRYMRARRSAEREAGA